MKKHGIITDEYGMARSIRSNCVQPVLHLIHRGGQNLYTAVMEIYEITT